MEHAGKAKPAEEICAPQSTVQLQPRWETVIPELTICTKEHISLLRFYWWCDAVVEHHLYIVQEMALHSLWSLNTIPMYIGTCTVLSKRTHPNDCLVMHYQQGDFVVLASEPVCLCGVDVAAPQQLRKKQGKSLRDFLSSFQDQLTQFEVMRATTCQAQFGSVLGLLGKENR